MAPPSTASLMRVGGAARRGRDRRDDVCRVGSEDSEGVVVGRYRQRHQQPNVCTTCRGGCCAVAQTLLPPRRWRRRSPAARTTRRGARQT